MHTTRKSWTFLVLFILLFTLTGCFDLGTAYPEASKGEIEQKSYYEAFGDVYLLDEDGSKSTYDISDFYSKEAVNNFKCAIDSKEYTYIGVELDKDLKIGDIVIYFYSEVSTTLGVSFYIVNEMPDDITYVDSLGVPHNLFDSDEPEIEDMIAKASTRLQAKKWTSVYLEKRGLTARFDVKEGQILLIRIENNCYDATKKALDKAEKNLTDAQATYQADLTDYNNKVSSGASQAEIDAAKVKMEASLVRVNEAQEAYTKAQKKYEEEKSPYTTRVSVKITDILINAE